MTDLPAAAVTAAHAAIACNVGDPGWAGKLKLSPHDLADIALEAAAPHITAAATAAHVTEQDAIHADLARLLRVLGLGGHARPQSPHEVFGECLTAVKRLLERLELAERAEGQIRAAATAAERQRCAQLAADVGATYFYACQTGVPATRRPFADLLTEGDTT